MPASASAAGRTQTQLAADYTSDGDLVPPGFEWETTYKGKQVLLRWGRANATITAGEACILVTPSTSVAHDSYTPAGTGVTKATAVKAGVAQAAMAAGDWGYFAVKGYTPAYIVGSVSAGDLLETVDTGFTDNTAVIADIYAVPSAASSGSELVDCWVDCE